MTQKEIIESHFPLTCGSISSLFNAASFCDACFFSEIVTAMKMPCYWLYFLEQNITCVLPLLKTDSVIRNRIDSESS